MLRKLDRIAIVLIAALVGLQAIIPGWQIMTDGSVYGFKLPTSWLSAAWPFPDFTVAGLVLLVVVGGGSLLTAAIAALSDKSGFVVSLLMGLVLVGWIGGELVFMSQTMVMTWIILASGLVMVVLSAPYALPQLRQFMGRTTGRVSPPAAPA